MKLKLRHNTLMRLISGSVLAIGLPGLFFLMLFPFVGWRWALVLPVLWWLLVAYGSIFGWRHIVVRTTTCSSPLLPAAFDGYRVLQLSDIHIGTFLRNRRVIDNLVKKVNDQHPDLIVFTGDLVNVSAEEVIPFQHALGQIHARDGIYSVMGNHDYCEYGADKSDRNISRNQNVLKYLETKIGWKLLLNEHVMITRNAEGGTRNAEGGTRNAEGGTRKAEGGTRKAEGGTRNAEGGTASIAVIGVENISRPPFPDYGDLKKAMAGLPAGMFKILLSHDPSHWRRGVLHQTDIALTLSGHTHAGQMKIGRFSPAKWAYNEWGGKYTEGGSMLYVSLGIGGTVPFRIGAWPEINVITLRSTPSPSKGGDVG